MIPCGLLRYDFVLRGGHEILMPAIIYAIYMSPTVL